MWETIQSMSTDRLWIWTALAGSIFGALFIAWITDTKIALWTYGKWSTLLNYLVKKCGWTWFKADPDAWKKLNPNLSNKIVDLETRIKSLEKIDECHCITCNPETSGMRMTLCPTCGNKRCPHATNHKLDCTNSNEHGQDGSVYSKQNIRG